MHVRQMELQELKALDRMEAVCFTYSFDETKQEPPQSLPEKRENWGCFGEDITLQGGMIANHYICRVGSHLYKMAGIGGVSTLPEYRRSGAIRAIFQAMLPDLRSRGFVLSGLYPFSHAFYRKFGYEYCYPSDIYELSASELLSYPQPKSAYMAVGSERLDEVKAIYEAFSKSRSLCLVREDEQDWKQIWSGDPYKDRVYRYILYNDSGAPCAYVNFTPKDRDGKRVAEVKELCFIDKPSFYLALGFLSRFHPHYNAVRLTLSTDVYLPALHVNPYEVEHKPNHCFMMRILDVPAFLSSLDCPAGSGRVTLDVRDEFLPENTGLYTICWQDGTLSCMHGGETPDLRLEEPSLAQLAMGFLPIDQLVFRRDVQLLGDPEKIAALFPRRALYIGDYF